MEWAPQLPWSDAPHLGIRRDLEVQDMKYLKGLKVNGLDNPDLFQESRTVKRSLPRSLLRFLSTTGCDWDHASQVNHFPPRVTWGCVS